MREYDFKWKWFTSLSAEKKHAKISDTEVQKTYKTAKNSNTVIYKITALCEMVAIKKQYPLYYPGTHSYKNKRHKLQAK